MGNITSKSLEATTEIYIHRSPQGLQRVDKTNPSSTLDKLQQKFFISFTNHMKYKIEVSDCLIFKIFLLRTDAGIELKPSIYVPFDVLNKCCYFGADRKFKTVASRGQSLH